MNIAQLETFLYISLTGSFSKAGEILYLSQPAISARIKSLEKEVGSPLFERIDNKIVLTEAGEIFLPFAKKGLEQLQDGALAIQKSDNKYEGELSVSVVLTVTNYILPILIKQFYEAFPKIKLTIHTGHSHHVLDMVLNHEAVIGISRSVQHPRIESVHLSDDEMVLVIYPDHPFASMDQITLEELTTEQLVLFNRGSIDWMLINNAFKSLGVEPNVVMESDNIELVKKMVKKKIGIGVLPKSAIQDELFAKDLYVTKIKNLPQINRPFELIYLKDTKMEGILKTFGDFMLENMKNI